MVPLWSGPPTSAETGVDVCRGGVSTIRGHRSRSGAVHAEHGRSETVRIRAVCHMCLAGCGQVRRTRSVSHARTEAPRRPARRVVRALVDRAVARVRTGRPPPGRYRACGWRPGRVPDSRKEIRAPARVVRPCWKRRSGRSWRAGTRPDLRFTDPEVGSYGAARRGGVVDRRRPAGRHPLRGPRGSVLGWKRQKVRGSGPGGAQVGAQPPEGGRGESLFLFPFPCSDCAVVLPGHAYPETPACGFTGRLFGVFLLCPDRNWCAFS